MTFNLRASTATTRVPVRTSRRPACRRGARDTFGLAAHLARPSPCPRRGRACSPRTSPRSRRTAACRRATGRTTRGPGRSTACGRACASPGRRRRRRRRSGRRAAASIVDARPAARRPRQRDVQRLAVVGELQAARALADRDAGGHLAAFGVDHDHLAAVFRADVELGRRERPPVPAGRQAAAIPDADIAGRDSTRVLTLAAQGGKIPSAAASRRPCHHERAPNHEVGNPGLYRDQHERGDRRLSER